MMKVVIMNYLIYGINRAAPRLLSAVLVVLLVVALIIILWPSAR
jgi:hypothetical protein